MTTATRIKPAAFTVGATVLRYQNHHDTAPTTEIVKAVTSRTVTLESGEKFGSDGVAWGKGSDWFAPYIKAAPAATETHRNDPPALTRVEAFDYLGFACKYGRDRETRDWLMEVDGNPIGYAVSSSAADTTIREHCDAVLAHTRATTADMAADAAAFRAELAERAGPEWNCTPENPCDGECAEHSPAAALEDAGTAAEPWHRAAWREDWHQRHPATPARAASAQTPPTPPRPVAELREELERVTDAIHDRKAVGAGYARLHQQRSHIIAELDEAHKVEDAALRQRLWEIITPEPWRCGSCGDPSVDSPSTGLCPACRESGEQPPYAALSDAAMAEPWIAQPAPSCANCDGSHHIQQCPADAAPSSPDDPCAGVRAELLKTQEQLEKAQLHIHHLSEIAQEEAGTADIKQALRKLRDERHEFGIVLQLVLDQVERGYDRLGWAQEQIRAFESIPSGLLTTDLRVSLIATIRTALKG